MIDITRVKSPIRTVMDLKEDRVSVPNFRVVSVWHRPLYFKWLIVDQFNNHYLCYDNGIKRVAMFIPPAKFAGDNAAKENWYASVQWGDIHRLYDARYEVEQLRLSN